MTTIGSPNLGVDTPTRLWPFIKNRAEYRSGYSSCFALRRTFVKGCRPLAKSSSDSNEERMIILSLNFVDTEKRVNSHAMRRESQASAERKQQNPRATKCTGKKPNLIETRRPWRVGDYWAPTPEEPPAFGTLKTPSSSYVDLRYYDMRRMQRRSLFMRPFRCRRINLSNNGWDAAR